MKKDCLECQGKGWYQYTNSGTPHSKICEACCEHEKGWWVLPESYKDAGKLCCLAGCGFTREGTPEEVTNAVIEKLDRDAKEATGVEDFRFDQGETWKDRWNRWKVWQFKDKIEGSPRQAGGYELGFDDCHFRATDFFEKEIEAANAEGILVAQRVTLHHLLEMADRGEFEDMRREVVAYAKLNGIDLE